MKNKTLPITVEKSIMVSDKEAVTTYKIYPGTETSSESGNILGLSIEELQVLYQLIGKFIQEGKGEKSNE